MSEGQRTAARTGAEYLVRQGYGSAKPVIRISVAAIVVFGTLYVFQSFGVPGMVGTAMLIAAGVLVYKERQRTESAYGR